jgi:hypothetical protein
MPWMLTRILLMVGPSCSEDVAQSDVWHSRHMCFST